MESYLTNAKHNSSKLDLIRVLVLWGFKLDHLQSVKLILFINFSNFLPFILERPILITPERERLKMGKWNSPNLSETQVFLVHGVFKLDHLQPVEPMLFPKFSNFSNLILERPILITPEREKG